MTKKQLPSPIRIPGVEFRITRRIRLGIMIALIMSFFIISPIVILYTAGYRYNLADRVLKGTGVVSIDVLPTDAQIYVNNIQIKKNLPIRLASLIPGNYRVTIKKPDFITWEKDMPVASNQTTFIKNVSLFKQSQPHRISGSAQDIEYVTPKNSTPPSQKNPTLTLPDPEGGIWSVATTTITRHGPQPGTDTSYTIDRQVTDIIDINAERIILKSDNSFVVLRIHDGVVENSETVSTGQIYFNPHTEEWWTWSDWELWSIYSNGKIALLNRSSEPMTMVRPLDTHGVALVANTTKIIAFNPGYSVSQDLASVGRVDQVAVDQASHKIYFTGQVGTEEGLFELEY